jgi:hypothetical protein
MTISSPTFGKTCSSTARRAAVACTLALAALAATPATGSAATPTDGGLSIAPASGAPTFVFDAAPGRVVRGAVRVSNRGSKTRVVRLQAVDMATADTGGAIYGDRAPSNNGRWLTLSAHDVELAPGTWRLVRFSARIPQGATPGDHYAGVVAADRNSTATPGPAPGKKRKITVDQVVRYALPATFRVPGPRIRRLVTTSANATTDASGGTVALGLRNAGNAIVQNTTVDLKLMRDGKVAGSTERHVMGQFLPASAIRYPIAVKGVPDGSYRLTGTITPEGAAPLRVDRTVRFTKAQTRSATKQAAAIGTPVIAGGIPLGIWLALGGAVGLVGALAVAFWRQHRRLAATKP